MKIKISAQNWKVTFTEGAYVFEPEHADGVFRLSVEEKEGGKPIVMLDGKAVGGEDANTSFVVDPTGEHTDSGSEKKYQNYVPVSDPNVVERPADSEDIAAPKPYSNKINPKNEKGAMPSKSHKMPLRKQYILSGAIVGMLVLLGLLVFLLFMVLGGSKEQFIPVRVIDDNLVEEIYFTDHNLSFCNGTIVWNGKDLTETTNKVELKYGPDGIIDPNQLLLAVRGVRDTIYIESPLHREYVVSIINAKADSAKAMAFAKEYPIYKDSVMIYLESIKRPPVAAKKTKVEAAIAGLFSLLSRLDNLKCSPADTEAITDFIAAHPELPVKERYEAERKIKAYDNFFYGEVICRPPGMTQIETKREFTRNQWDIIRLYYISPSGVWSSKAMQKRLNETPRSFHRIKDLKEGNDE